MEPPTYRRRPSGEPSAEFNASVLLFEEDHPLLPWALLALHQLTNALFSLSRPPLHCPEDLDRQEEGTSLEWVLLEATPPPLETD